MARVVGVLLLILGTAVEAAAQDPPPCRVICDVDWKVEPTITFENIAKPHRIRTADGATERAAREQVFEVVLAMGLETKVPWLGFTVEAITAPFEDGNDVELEFESNVSWLTESMTRGWVTSHVDVVDKFSPAERPDTRRAYTHKLNFELDTAFHPFQRLPAGRWLRGVEIEASLDYVATGLPKRGDVFADGSRMLDDASPWSISLVFVLPVAPF